MTDNEKAAVAAGLWEPFAQASWGEWGDEHGNVAPDMHLPENLWRAQENLNEKFSVVLQRSRMHNHWYFRIGGVIKSDPTLVETMFAALVALYDAEHP